MSASVAPPAVPSMGVPSVDDVLGGIEGQGTVDFEDTPLWELAERRRSKGQDMIVLLSDHQNRRGTGKTWLSLLLGEWLDFTDAGLTPNKVAIDPHALADAYTREARGSSLVLDEAEVGVGNRDSMTVVNKAVNKLMSMARVEEKFVVLNAPNANRIDVAIRELADVWILVENLGRARVYRLMNNPFNGQVYNKEIQTIYWDAPSGESEVARRLGACYDALHQEKMSRLKGDVGGGEFVRASECAERVEKAEAEAALDMRNEFIRALYDQDDLGLTFGDVAGLLPDDVAVGAEQVRQVYHKTAET